MVCISSCLIGAGFLGSSILTMLKSKNSGTFKKFDHLLNIKQKEIYKKVINERASIYTQGIIIGTILGLLSMSMIKTNKISKVCIFIVIALGFNYLYYMLYPKTTYMLLHLTNQKQNEAWLNIYTEMKKRCILGFILGVIGYFILARGACN